MLPVGAGRTSERQHAFFTRLHADETQRLWHSKFQRNQIVHVSFDIGWGRQRKFRGTVQRVNNDQQGEPTYDVLFEDGDKRTQVEEQWISSD